jgi:hypothetical protein
LWRSLSGTLFDHRAATHSVSDGDISLAFETWAENGLYRMSETDISSQWLEQIQMLFLVVIHGGMRRCQNGRDGAPTARWQGCFAFFPRRTKNPELRTIEFSELREFEPATNYATR